jgi:phospholipid-transporting ATPase
VSWFICYYFYKNIVVVFTELWFAIFNGFSTQIYFLEWLPMLYNSFFTSWPCMFTYIFEQDANAEYSMQYPQLYAAGQKQIYFTFKRFWMWVGLSIVHGLICYWIPIAGFESHVDSSGIDTGLWWISTLSFTLIIHVVTIKLFVESVYWNKVNLIVGAASILLYYITIMILNTDVFSATFQSPQLYFVFFKVLGNGKAWLFILLAPFMAVIPDIIIVIWRSNFKPNPVDKVMRW